MSHEQKNLRTSRFIDRALYAVARLQNKARLSAIRNTTIGFDTRIESGSQVVDTNIGRHSYCGSDCIVLNAEIGSFCSIAQNVYIGGETHPLHFVSTSPVFLSHRDSVKAKFSMHNFKHVPRTTIGHDVWIGNRSTIKAGVTVGIGAAVGMGAVVTKDVAPYTIVGGNPAKEIRKRFEPHIVEALLRSKWWDFSNERLRSAARLFVDPEAFLREGGFL